MIIFDGRVPIHETPEDIEPMGSLINQLSHMLNQNGVRHSLALATEKEMEDVRIEKGKELLFWLFYETEQHTELTLVIALFSKIFIKKNDADILTTIVKAMSEAA